MPNPSHISSQKVALTQAVAVAPNFKHLFGVDQRDLPLVNAMQRQLG